jgi:uncharacterized membrane protein
MQSLVAYAATAVAFIVIDLIWLGVIAKSFYRRELGDLIAQPFNLKAAAVFYLAYPLGVVFFATWPALSAGSAQQAALMGLLLGLFAYGTYDLTNLATLRNWSLKLSVADMVWGSVLTGISAWIGFLAARQF